jgi:hypothetical protein
MGPVAVSGALVIWFPRRKNLNHVVRPANTERGFFDGYTSGRTVEMVNDNAGQRRCF